VTIDSNLIRGNGAEGGQGGGIRLQQVNGADIALAQSQWSKVTVSNNMIENNMAGWAGGGISMSDTLVSSIFDNTIASNDAAGIAGVVLTAATSTTTSGTGIASPAGIASEITSAALSNTLPNDASRFANKISQPVNFENNIIWKNRSFFYKVVNGRPSLCSSNNAADSTSTVCNTLKDQAITGECVMTSANAAPAYWDLGVVGDLTVQPTVIPAVSVAISSANQFALLGTRFVLVTTSAPHGFSTGQTVTIGGFAGTGANLYNGPRVVLVSSASSFVFDPGSNGVASMPSLVAGTATAAATTIALNPTYSVLTSIAGYTGIGLKASDPMLNDMSCNGSRVTPEYVNVLNPPSLKNLQVGATVDEGNNYVTLNYGPLSLMKPTDATGSTFVPFGDMHLQVTLDPSTGLVSGSTSSAFHAANAVGSPSYDFDGGIRPTGIITAGQVSNYDIGADQIAFPSPIMVVTPNPLAFGAVSINTSKVLSVTVANDAAATANLVLNPATIVAGTSGNSQPAKYAFTTTCPTGLPGLLAGTSCTVSVSFAPTAVTLQAQTATLDVNAMNAPMIAVPMSGTAVIPTYAINPGPLVGHNFGNQQVGNASAPFQFTLTNTAASAGGELWLTGNPTSSNGQFVAAFAAGDSCTATTHLATGASCTFSVVFTPNSTGAKGTGILNPGARVDVTHAAGAVNAGVTGSPVWGAGQAPSATLTGTAAFGGVAVGVTSAATSFTYTNTGIGPITVSTVALSSTTDFAIVSDSCIVAGVGVTLAPNGTCLVGVTFKPASAGAHSANLVVNDTAAGVPTTTLALSGTGQTFSATLTGTTGFGNRQVGTTSPATSFTYRNTGNAATTVSSVTLSSTVNYAIASNTCTASLAPNATCTIGVTFTPSTASAANALTANLTVTNAANVAVSVALTGTGVQAGAAFSWPNNGTVGAWGNNSGARTITVTNSGPNGSQLSLSAIPVVANTVGSQFARTGGTCAATTVLASNASCTVIVTRTRPTGALQPAAGTITVTDTGAATSSQQLVMSGI
jgi:hypothetical protein